MELHSQDNVKSPDNNQKDVSNNNNENTRQGENNFFGKCFIIMSKATYVVSIS